MPITLQEAREFVAEHHRHHPAPQGGRFAIGAFDKDQGTVCGVVIVGNPVARILHDEWTCEVTRLCVLDHVRNCCSFLYGAAWRAARQLGYRRLITYTLQTESGDSLRGAGFHIVGEVKGRSWHTPSRPRVDKTPLLDKWRWEVTA